LPESRSIRNIAAGSSFQWRRSITMRPRRRDSVQS